jgi:SAM-dependent methyltransferase
MSGAGEAIVWERTRKFDVLSLGQVHTEEEKSLRKVFEAVTAEYETARECSRRERAACPEAQNLTYGEVPYEAVEQIIAELRKHDPSLFGRELTCWDLGSGSGSPLIAAALLLPSGTHLVGVEILQSLHDLALQSKKKFDAQQCGNNKTSSIEFIRGSLLDEPWPKSADVILANSTCFSIPFFAQIEKMSHACKKGTFFVSLTHCLGADDDYEHWELLDTHRFEMSWGAADVCISRRR